jgi:molybdate transport system substrate-binding protein
MEGDITVLAAASLTDAFAEVGSAFEDGHPGTSVDLSFGPSSGLATQITEGAPADVFASASPKQMDVVVDDGDAQGDPRPFVTNLLEIAVPPGNPGHVNGLRDFARDELLIGLCAEEVPCGQFGREALSGAGVTPAVDTNETDVRALLTKIQEGELDAGIVYETDVLAAKEGVEGIAIPDDENVVARYPIVSLSDSDEPEVASAFVDFVLSPDGLDIMQRYGFGAP